jgi:hypothetical protein
MPHPAFYVGTPNIATPLNVGESSEDNPQSLI